MAGGFRDVLTAQEMRDLESQAIEAGQVSGLELMERAGQGVVDAILGKWPELAAQPAAPRLARARIWCGPGNNGGDGFVIARLLHARGWEIDLRLSGDPARLPPDARSNYERWSALGTVLPIKAPADQQVDVEIDALFGTGLTRAIDDPALWEVLGTIDSATEVPAHSPQTYPRTVAVDIPSGLHTDTGTVIGGPCAHGRRAPRVMLTVTFHSPKPGHYLAQGPAHCGDLVIHDIGLFSSGEKYPRRRHPDLSHTRLIQPPPGASLSKSGGHKFSHGHALILSGGAGRTGAARLAARGALRIGAGLVTLAVPKAAESEVAAQITALMMCKLDTPDDLTRQLQAPRITALCLGPGLGPDRARDLVSAALASDRPVVLDADALSAFAGMPERLFDRLTASCVLTPHDGEFARLFPDLSQAMQDSTAPMSKVAATRQAAARAGCVVLLKGHDTVIASPSGDTALHAASYAQAVPWLATAGAGDVLAGFITGLMARGIPAQQAAEYAVWLHADCARRFGPGLIGEDLPEMLPQVLAASGQ